MTFGRSELASLVLAALAVASAVLVFATRTAPTTGETSERAEHLFSVFRKDTITGFSLELGKERVELERTGEHFELKAPVREPADEAEVARLLDGIGFATFQRRLPDPDRNRLGLATPRAKLVLVMNGARRTLSLGSDAPAPAGSAYVEVDDGKGRVTTGVVTREVRALLLVRADDFRRHALLDFGTREIAELAIERAGSALGLTRGNGVAFRIDGRTLVDRDRAAPLLAAVSGLTASRFVELASAEKSRGSAAWLTVRVKPRDSQHKTAVLELGGACPLSPGEILAIARAPALRAACIKENVLSLLSVEPSVLVLTAPFTARKDEVETLALERGGKSLVMTRSGSGFILKKPSEANIDLETGNQRLESILRAPGDIVQNPAPAELGLEPPSGRAVVTLIGDDDKPTEERLDLGRTKADGTLAVRRGEDGVVLLLGRDAARAFEVDSTLLRSPKVLDFPLSALSELELAAPEHQLLRRAPNGFSLALPPGFQHDGELATRAVLALGSLTAQRFVADADDGSFGFGEPTLTAKFRIDQADAGVTERLLVVGRSSPGGYFAKLADTPGVFLLERAVAERLSVLLIDRGVFIADPATLARVTFASGAKKLELERRAGELAPSAGGTIDPRALAPALEALGSLRAEAALHSGPARTSEGFSEPALRVTLEPSAGFGPKRSFSIGKSDSYLGQNVRFARVDRVEATFAIAEAKLRPMFDLF